MRVFVLFTNCLYALGMKWINVKGCKLITVTKFLICVIIFT